MSYAAIGPAIYETYQPGTPWHAGSSGWSRPFWPGWAQNPNLVGTPRKAVQGLGCGSGGGCGCGCKGVGAAEPSMGLKIAVGAGLLAVIALGIKFGGRL